MALSIILSAGGTQRLARLVGKGKTLGMILTGRIVDAAEAHRIGLVTGVTVSEALGEAVRETARAILRKGPLAVRLAKLAIQTSFETEQKTGLVVKRLA